MLRHEAEMKICTVQGWNVRPGLKAGLSSLIVLGLVAFSAGQVPYMDRPVLSEKTTKVSEHVWEITGFPNVAIVVGSCATLVVDTGLGPKNGAIVARVAARLSAKNSKLFLTTTHYHPEHTAGEPGFPKGTILIRNTVQQQEMEERGKAMIDMFHGRSPAFRDLLTVDELRTPDITFEKEANVDLGGGVRVRLFWFGGAHTNGDELTLVEPDQTLISGDVVQNKTLPRCTSDKGTPTTWLAVLDEIAKLNVAHVLPDHSEPGDGSLVAAERDLIASIRTQALALKGQGVSVDTAGKQVSDDLKKQHPDWPNTNASDFVKSVYADPDMSK